MVGGRLASIEATDGWVGGAYAPKAVPDKHIFAGYSTIRPSDLSLRTYILPLTFLSVFIFFDKIHTLCLSSFSRL